MEVCFLFTVLLILVTLVGKGLWELLALAWSAVFSGPDVAPAPLATPATCARCGTALGQEPVCPRCQLDCRGTVAAELHELEAAARRIQGLLEAGTLDRETCEKVYRGIETRQQQLIRQEEPGSQAPVTETSMPAATTPGRPLLLNSLERLLTWTNDYRDLSEEDRRLVFLWYNQVPETLLASMTASALITLARLLHSRFQVTEALRICQLLVSKHPKSPGVAEAALEAGRLAALQGWRDQACWFLEHALTHDLPADLGPAAAKLLRINGGASRLARLERLSEPILDVLAVEEPHPVFEAVEPAPAPPVPEPVPPPPRRSWGEMLAGFMEERNILWGELVGGSLIVGCSIALVISLWHTLEQIPYFPFVIFAALTASLFGAGLYTLKHWKLESTSRGLLVIASLLVPLSFLVLAGLSRGREGGLLEIAAEVVSLGVFAWLVNRAAQVLVAADLPTGRIPSAWLLTLAVLGSSASQLLVPRLLDANQPPPFLAYLLSLLPVACQTLPAGWVIQWAAREKGLAVRQTIALLLFVGLATAALAVALGFLVYWCDDWQTSWHRLSVAIALGGVPTLLAGALVHRQAMPASAAAEAEGSSGTSTAAFSPATARMVGTGVALGSTLFLLAACLLAWPWPVSLVMVCAVNCTALTFVAVSLRLPLAYGPAMGCLAVGYLTAFHLITGHLPGPAADWSRQLLASAVSPQNGTALVLLALLLLAASEALNRWQRRLDGWYVSIGCGLAALASMILVLRDGPRHPGQVALVFTLCGAGCWAGNFRWRRPLLSYGAGILLLVGMVWLLTWQVPTMPLARQLLLAALAHATLVGSLSLLPDKSPGARARSIFAQVEIPDSQSHSEVFSVPLFRTALTVSCLAVVALLFAMDWDWLEPLAVCTLWLAGIWLVIAWKEIWPSLFTGFQAALSLSVVLAVTAWVRQQTWVVEQGFDFWNPWSLQAYGIGLAVLALAWVIARLVARGTATAQALLEPPEWPALDRVMLVLLVAGQFLLAAWNVLPGILNELDPAGYEGQGLWPDAGRAFDPAAWVLLALLTLVLLLSFRDRLLPLGIFMLVVLAVTVPLLAAGRWAEQWALASALRWGLALTFVAGSVPIWLRGNLADLLRRTRLIDSPPGISANAPLLLVNMTVVPALVLTLVVAVQGFAGIHPHGPGPQSIFAQLGWTASTIVPLVLLSLGLTGHGLRERSASFMLAAGLLADVTLMAGYALAIVTTGGKLGADNWAHILQLGTIGGAIWVLAWTGCWRWQEAAARRDQIDALERQAYLTRKLMTVMACWAAFWLALLTCGAWVALVSLTPDEEFEADLYGPASAWTLATGSLWSWIAVGLMALAGLVRPREQGRPASFRTWMLVSLALVILLACTVEGWLPGAGYRTLMVGTAGIVLAWAIGLGRLQASDRITISPSGTSETTVIGLGVCLSLFLSLRGAFVYWEPVWAAGASVLVSGALATLAWVRRSEMWMFAAGLVFNLAVSLLVWRAHLDEDIHGWWVALLQVNVITAGLVALGWLRLRGRLYHPMTLESSPFLQFHLLLCLLGNCIWLVPALVHLLQRPGGPMAAILIQSGQATGWAALIVTASAGFRCAGLMASGQIIHLTGCLGLLAGILTACSFAPLDRGDWLTHHVLTVAWSVTGLVILLAGWASSQLNLAGPAFWSSERRARTAAWLAEEFPVNSVCRWLEAIGLLVILLALRGGWGDPARPYPSAAATLTVSVMAGALALWSRRPIYVYLSGLLINLAAYLVWQAWLIDHFRITVWMAYGPGVLDTFLLSQVLALAAASLGWSLVAGFLTRAAPHFRGQVLLFRALSIQAGLGVLGILVLGGVAADLTGDRLEIAGWLAWAALAATIVALATFLWDAEAPSLALPLPQLYAAGLLMIGLALHGNHLTPTRLLWAAGPLLALYGLLCTSLAWVFTGSNRILRLPAASSWPAAGFFAVQAMIGSLALALSMWICLGYQTWPERLAGPLSAALLVPVCLLAHVRLERDSQVARFLPSLTLALGVVVLVEMCWSTLGPGVPAPVLQCSGLLLASLVVSGCGYATLLPRLLPEDWATETRRMGRSLIGLACGVLPIFMVQQLWAYNPVDRYTPLLDPIVLLDMLAIVALIVGAIYQALTADFLSEKRRRLYVYAGEGLVVLLLLHFRVNYPDLFPTFLGNHWTLVVMTVSFLLAGLGEFFRRRGIPVLAVPLHRTGVLLPFLPLAAFLVQPLTELRAVFDKNIPGMQPVLRYLDKLPRNYGMNAFLWFLLGLLYNLVALARRSTNWALLGALAGNFGLWILIGHQEHLVFTRHPQLWLIPLALILLAAEHLNREHLPAGQSTGLRYFGALLIYASSSADMFITGLGQSVLLPVLLALLAICGVLAGIFLRVQAFLFMGVVFLFEVIFAQIWHAAVDRNQPWVWWASGIVLGAGILTLFALFEKRRNDVLLVIERIKRWD